MSEKQGLLDELIRRIEKDNRTFEERSTILWEFYATASPAHKTLMDVVFLCLCDSTLGSLIRFYDNP